VSVSDFQTPEHRRPKIREFSPPGKAAPSGAFKQARADFPGLTDAHLHLQHEAFAADLQGVLGRADAAGVERLASCGTRPADWPRLLELARAHPRVVIPSFGVHPWFAAEAREGWLSELERFLDAVPSGVGEAGLDRTPRGAPVEVQERVFRAQLALARRRGLPLSVHCVRALGRLLELLNAEPPPPFLLHAYAGSAEAVEPLARLGAYFSFAPFNLAGARAIRAPLAPSSGVAAGAPEGARTRAREALLAVPPDPLLFESAAPDAPRPPCSEPSLLPSLLADAARLRGMDARELAALCRENARRLFGR